MSRFERSRSRSPFDDSREARERERVHNRLERVDRSRDRSNERKHRPDRLSGGRPGGRGSRDDTKVYMSNIPFEYKWQDLKDLIRDEVGESCFVEVFSDENNRPRGCAVLDFESPEVARKVIDKLHRFEVKNRKLVLKDKFDAIRSRDFAFLFSRESPGRPRGMVGMDMDRGRGGRFESGPMGPQGPPGPNKFGNTFGLSIPFLESLGIRGPLVSKVFVANLDYKVTDEDLKEVFKVAGTVVESKVVKDADGKSRGFGTVEYEHPVQAVQAISMLNNQIYHDRQIGVRMDKIADSKKDSSSSKLPPGLKSLGMGLGLNGTALTDITTLPSLTTTQSQAPLSNMGMGNMGMGTSMPMNSMPMMNSAGPMDGMNSIGSMGGGGMNMMGMGGTANGLPSQPMGGGGFGPGPDYSSGGGSGFSNMPPRGMGGSGFGMSNSSFGSGVGGFGSGGTGVGFSSSSAGFSSGGGAGFGSSHTSRDFRDVGYDNRRQVVEIANLPLDCSWQVLKDLCREYGDIGYADIVSKGVGSVRFNNSADARRCAEMLDRQKFNGRILNARLV